MNLEQFSPACLFAAHWPNGVMPQHVGFYVRELHNCRIRVIVGHAGKLQPDQPSMKGLRSSGVEFVERDNQGLDFGTWQHLIRLGYARNASAILLANDSVFGPFFDLLPIIRRMRERELDVWGMVETLQGPEHLQSWWVWIERHVFLHPAVQRVFALQFGSMTKEEIIVHGELGLSAAFRAAEAKIGAVWSARSAGRRIGLLIPTNPMHMNFVEVFRGGVPFIKVELLRDNPIQVPWVPSWRALVSDASKLSVAWVEEYLEIARSGPSTQKPIRRTLIQLCHYGIMSPNRLAVRALVRMGPEAVLEGVRTALGRVIRVFAFALRRVFKMRPTIRRLRE